MEFLTEKKCEDGYWELQISPIREEFDHNRRVHKLIYDIPYGSPIPIFEIDGITGEVGRFEDVPEDIKNDTECQTILNRFLQSTLFVKGDTSKIKDWFLNQLSQYYNIGFKNEFVIEVKGENWDEEDKWWVIKRQVRLSINGEHDSHPIFVIRYEDNLFSDEFKSYGEEAAPYDLYISEDSEYRPEIYADILTKDILKQCPKPYSISIQYSPR